MYGVRKEFRCSKQDLDNITHIRKEKNVSSDSEVIRLLIRNQAGGRY